MEINISTLFYTFIHQNITVHYAFINLRSLFLPPGSEKRSCDRHMTYLYFIDHVVCDVLFVPVYSDALKNSFFPRTVPMWNSLPSSVFASKTPEEFKGPV